MSGIVVALVGPDGTGKSTIAARLPELFDEPVKTLYAGDNPEAGDMVLPTTRLLWWFRRQTGHEVVHGPRPIEPRVRRSPLRRALGLPRSVLLFVNQCLEERARLRRATRWAARGSLVVLDRSYLHDYWHHDVVGAHRSTRERMHGWWLRHALPRPDLTIVLDAPAEVLHVRKPEGTLAALARRREEYRDLGNLTPATVVVDAQLPPARVLHEVAGTVREHLVRSRRTR